MGIKETTELAKFGGAIGAAIGVALQDGKFGFDDISAFFRALSYMEDAFAGIEQVSAELADMNDEERQQLYSAIRDEFKVAPEDTAGFAEDSLNLAEAIFRFYRRTMALVS